MGQKSEEEVVDYLEQTELEYFGELLTAHKQAEAAYQNYVNYLVRKHNIKEADRLDMRTGIILRDGKAKTEEK